MAADMYLHSGKNLKEEDYKCFFAHNMGSKYFRPGGECGEENERTYTCRHWDAMTDSDSFRIGEVSWLKAALFDDESFIPDPIGALAELLEDYPVLTPELRDAMMKASEMENKTQYDVLTDSEVSLREWLDAHMGEVVFQISW